jgi:hypothetical protein
MSFGPEPRNNPNAKAVVAEFKAKGFEPEGYTLYSYAGDADHQAGGREGQFARSQEDRRSHAFRHAFHTVIGDIAYDKKGDRTSVDYVWYVWKKGDDGKITYPDSRGFWSHSSRRKISRDWSTQSKFEEGTGEHFLSHVDRTTHRNDPHGRGGPFGHWRPYALSQCAGQARAAANARRSRRWRSADDVGRSPRRTELRQAGSRR